MQLCESWWGAGGALEAAEKVGNSGEIFEKRSSGAEARANFAESVRGLKPPPPSELRGG
jgi:hypothetical protein